MPNPTPDSPILNVPQVCAYLGVGRDIVYTLAARNDIPHFHVGRYLRFNREDLEKWAHSEVMNAESEDGRCVLAPRFYRLSNIRLEDRAILCPGLGFCHLQCGGRLSISEGLNRLGEYGSSPYALPSSFQR